MVKAVTERNIWQGNGQENRFYGHNPKPLSGGLNLTLTQDVLLAERNNAKQVFQLASLEQITLTFTPRNSARMTFTCHIRARDGRSVTFNTLSWKSLTHVDKQFEEYRSFLLALLSRTSAVNPHISLKAGLPHWRYYGMCGLGVIMLLALAGTGLYALTKGNIPIALFGFALMAYIGWWLRDMLTRNMPQAFTAQNIPQGVLP